MYRLTFLLLPAYLISATEWRLADPGVSCADTCGAENLECDNHARLQLDSFQAISDVFEAFGKRCLDCENGCTIGSKSGPVVSNWQGDQYYCSFNNGANYASCDQTGSGGSQNICACEPSGNGEPVVPFPDGDDFKVSMTNCGQDGNGETSDLTLKWTTECQPDPMNLDEDSLTVECSDEVSGAIKVTIYQGACADGDVDQVFTIEDGVCMEELESRFEIEQWVIDECKGDDGGDVDQGECCSASLVDNRVTMDTCCPGHLMQNIGRMDPDDLERSNNFDESYDDCIQWGVETIRSKGTGYVKYDRDARKCQLFTIGQCNNGMTSTPCPEPQAEPTNSPTAAVTSEPTSSVTTKPTSRVPQPVAPVTCYSLGDPHFWYFDGSHGNFQTRGEFTLYKTNGLEIQVRQGASLTNPTNNHVSTNHGVAIKGSQTCGHLFEIFAPNGGTMKVTRANGQIDNYAGTANIMAGFSNYNCPSIATSGIDTTGDIWTNSNDPIAEFNLDHSQVRVQIQSYGINIWMEVEGAWLLATDSGICTKRSGAYDQIECVDSFFTVYGPGECPGLDRKEIPPVNIDECPTNLRQEAERRCNLCPKIINPNDCVTEVCALEDITAADELLKACKIATPVAPKRDVQCVTSGDPHFLYFDGSRRDFQDRGEFVLYQHGTDVKVHVRHGERPDVPTADHISTNHAAAIGGDMTCNKKYEFYYDVQAGQRAPADIRNVEPKLKVRDSNGNVEEAIGAANILSLLDSQDCPTIGHAGGIYEFGLGDGAVRVRVQLQWYGINVWVDVKGYFYDEKDSGICTKREGAFEQLSCRKSLFTLYKAGEECATVERREIELVDVVEGCPTQLKLEAAEVCGQCPEVISEEDCLMETCAIGNIQAAHDLLEACEGGNPIIPEPTPMPAPKPDVSCVSVGDPHMRYFDNTGNDFQSRGEFTLYKNDNVNVQVRQAAWIGLSPTHPVYDIVSTNNAMAIEGIWTCNTRFEFYATQPQKMIITKNGVSTTSTGIADIINAVSNADCPTVNVAAGNIVEFSMAGVMKLRFQIQSWGMNVWIDLKGEAYQDTDSGICTKREGAFTAIESCEKSLFTSFPEDKCDKVEVVDIENQEIECNADLEREALDVCQACPNVVSVKDCVFEVCALGDISAAHSLLEACDLDKPLDVEECGNPGKIKKSDAKKLNRQLAKILPKRVAQTACVCAEACQNIGGTEFQFKEKKGKCSCFQNVKKITIGGSNRKRVVGKLEGSNAVESSKQ